MPGVDYLAMEYFEKALIDTLYLQIGVCLVPFEGYNTIELISM